MSDKMSRFEIIDEFIQCTIAQADCLNYCCEHHHGHRCIFKKRIHANIESCVNRVQLKDIENQVANDPKEIDADKIYYEVTHSNGQAYWIGRYVAENIAQIVTHIEALNGNESIKIGLMQSIEKANY